MTLNTGRCGVRKVLNAIASMEWADRQYSSRPVNAQKEICGAKEDGARAVSGETRASMGNRGNYRTTA